MIRLGRPSAVLIEFLDVLVWVALHRGVIGNAFQHFDLDAGISDVSYPDILNSSNLTTAPNWTTGLGSSVYPETVQKVNSSNETAATIGQVSAMSNRSDTINDTISTTPVRHATTQMTVSLTFAPNRSFDALTFKGEFSKAMGVDTEDIEIESVSYNVTVAYSFPNISLDAARHAIADALEVPENTVVVSIDLEVHNSSRVAMRAFIQADSAEAAEHLMESVINTTATSNQLENMGVDAIVILKEAPNMVVHVQTTVASKSGTHVEAPHPTSLALMGNNLGASVSVRDVVKQAPVTLAPTPSPAKEAGVTHQSEDVSSDRNVSNTTDLGLGFGFGEVPRATTNMTVGLVLASNQTLNISTFKEELARAIGVDAENIVIQSISYKVTVSYSFSAAVPVETARQAIADSLGVSVDKVRVTVDSGERRLTDLGVHLQAVVEADSGEAAGQLMAKTINASAVSEQLESQGFPVAATVKEAPETSVDIQTTVVSNSDTPVDAPSPRALAQMGSNLGAIVSVRDVLKQVPVAPAPTLVPPGIGDVVYPEMSQRVNSSNETTATIGQVSPWSSRNDAVNDTNTTIPVPLISNRSDTINDSISTMPGEGNYTNFTESEKNYTNYTIFIDSTASRSDLHLGVSADECTSTVACAYSDAAPRLLHTIAGILGSRGAIAGGDVSVTGDLSGDAGPAIATRLRTPRSVAVDVRARALYVADQDDSAVRRVDLATGVISTILGTQGSAGRSGDKGHPNLHQLKSPMGVAVDSIKQQLFVADSGNHVVRVLDLVRGSSVVLAGIPGHGSFCGDGGPAAAACLRFPRGVAVDAIAGELYIADTHNHIVRLVNLTSGEISTAVGMPAYGGRRSGNEGRATSSQLFFPNDVAVDPVWRQLFIADTNNHVVRLVDLATGMLSTIAGVLGVYGYSGDGGAASSALFNLPDSMTVDPAARQLYVADTYNHVVRKLDLWTGNVSTIAGVPVSPGLVDERGPATAARLYLPTGVSVEWDPQAMQRRTVNPPEHFRTYSSSNSSNAGSMLDGSMAWVADLGAENRTEWMQVDLEIVRIVSGIVVQGQPGAQSEEGVTSLEVWYSTDSLAWDIVPSELVRITPLNETEHLVFPRPVQARHIRFYVKNWNKEIAMRAGVLVIDFVQARLLYVADSNNHVTRAVDLASHALSTVVGTLGFYGNGDPDGSIAETAALHQPRGVTVDSLRKLLYVADTSNHVVRRIDLASGLFSTFVGVPKQKGLAGDGGPATSAQLNLPYGVAVDAVAQKLYVADTSNHAVRICSTASSGTPHLETVAGVLGFPGHNSTDGLATSVLLKSPYGVAVDSSGHRLFVADTGNHVVRLVNLATGQISLVAGVPASYGRSGDSGPATSAQLNYPYGVALELTATAHSLYIADSSNHAVRRVDLDTGILSTVAGILGSPGHAGDGDPAIAAQLNFPYGVALDPLARRLYIGDNLNHAVRLVDLASGTLMTVAGVLGVFGISGDGGRATWAHLHSPMGVAIDSEAQQLFVADADNHAVRRLAVSNDLRVDGW